MVIMHSLTLFIVAEVIARLRVHEALVHVVTRVSVRVERVAVPTRADERPRGVAAALLALVLAQSALVYVCK